MLDGGGPPTAGPDRCREGNGSEGTDDGMDSLTEDTTGSLAESGTLGIPDVLSATTLHNHFETQRELTRDRTES